MCLIFQGMINNLITSSNNESWNTMKLKIPLMRKIKEAIREKKAVYVLLLDLSNLNATESKHAADNILTLFRKYIWQRARLYLYPADVLSFQKLGEDLFIIYLSHNNAFDPYELQNKITDLKEALIQAVKRSVASNPVISVNASYSTLYTKNISDIERSIFYSIKEAFQNAGQEYDWENEKKKRDLTLIIAQKRFNTLYQPLVSLESGRIFGYEALTRGPENTFFYYPDNLFPFAEDSGLLLQLEMATRELAIRGFSGQDINQKLFINLNPQIISDPSFARGKTFTLLREYGILPQNVVFEITERSAIDDFTSFKKTLLHYRDEGFMVAVDDAGAGYSSLQSIAELKPDFIKIDKSLVQNVDQDLVKRSLMETFVTFANKINSKIIAEGIETADELKVISDMGVPFGQGYFFAKPGNLPEISEQAVKALEIFSRKKSDIDKQYIIELVDIISNTKCVNKDTPTKEVAEYFIKNEHAKSVVVQEKKQPIGLIMRDKMFQKLGIQYGVALYWDRPVALIMDANPLIIEDHQPLSIVSQLAAGRNSAKLYDDILVNKDNQFLGTVSVQNLHRALN